MEVEEAVQQRENLGGVYVINCGGTNSDTLHPYGECGNFPDNADQYDMWECFSSGEQRTALSTDCPDCPTPEGAVGANSFSLIFTARATLISVLTLSDAAKDWVNNPDNDAEIDVKVTAAHNYRENHGIDGIYPPEVDAFLEQLIEAWSSTDFSTLFALDVFNQDIYNVWKNLSIAEKDLIMEFPLEAYGIFENRDIANAATIAKFGFNGRNDKSEAFRHAYYNVINAKVVGVDMAKLFSDAHESENPIILVLEEQMDLFNNNIGHQSISGNGSLSLSQLADLIYQRLLNGDLRYLSPLDTVVPPFYGINSLTQLIPTNQ
ncbi:hypothetical protein JYT89_00535 [Flavobacteriaceae bacterium AH-315-B10]|nr:hypothetical protein [Flavobacteriaceae bacterium AH-315-B10]